MLFLHTLLCSITSYRHFLFPFSFLFLNFSSFPIWVFCPLLTQGNLVAFLQFHMTHKWGLQLGLGFWDEMGVVSMLIHLSFILSVNSGLDFFSVSICLGDCSRFRVSVAITSYHHCVIPFLRSPIWFSSLSWVLSLEQNFFIGTEHFCTIDTAFFYKFMYVLCVIHFLKWQSFGQYSSLMMINLLLSLIDACTYYIYTKKYDKFKDESHIQTISLYFRLSTLLKA